MLGIDPKELPELEEKYAMELWQALKQDATESNVEMEEKSNSRCHAKWFF